MTRDANSVINALNKPAGPVLRRLHAMTPADVGVSAIVLHTEDARRAGEIRAWLAAQGTPIGAYDGLIAGQARAGVWCW